MQLTSILLAAASSALYLATGTEAHPLNVCVGKCHPFLRTAWDLHVKADSGVYKGQTVGAAFSDPSYMTYFLVKGRDECLTKCEQTKGW